MTTAPTRGLYRRLDRTGIRCVGGDDIVAGLTGIHVLVLLGLVALDVLALVQVWRDRRRSDAVKILWTVVILALPGIGLLGWAVNWLLGAAADRLNRGRTS